MAGATDANGYRVPGDEPVERPGGRAERAGEVERLERELEAERREHLQLVAERLTAMERAAALEAQVAALEGRLAGLVPLEAELAALRGTKTFRATAGLRRAYGRLRGRR